MEESQEATDTELVANNNIIHSSQTVTIYRQNLFSNEVAVKVLTKVNPCTEDFNLMQNECHVANSINHPNI